MARQLHEIKKFNIGTVSNSDNRDIPDEAAVASLGVDSNSPGGILAARPYDTAAHAGNSNDSWLISSSRIFLTATLGGSVSDTVLTLQGQEADNFKVGWEILIER